MGQAEAEWFNKDRNTEMTTDFRMETGSDDYEDKHLNLSRIS